MILRKKKIIRITFIIINNIFVSAQASTGRQGVLGPTKIYLAVQPTNTDANTETPSNPPPLVPVQSVITQSTAVVNQIAVQNVTPVQQVCSKT